jgi:hypothetical protein
MTIVTIGIAVLAVGFAAALPPVWRARCSGAGRLEV